MATVRINRVNVNFQAATREVMPLRFSQPVAGASITSSGSTQAAGLSAKIGEIWDIKVIGGNVWIKAGVSPTAAANQGDLLSDGDRLHLAVTDAGEDIAVINA